MSRRAVSGRFRELIHFFTHLAYDRTAFGRYSVYTVLYRDIFRKLPFAVAVVDCDLVVHDANEAFGELVGDDLEAVIGSELAVDFASDETASAVRAAACGGELACDATTRLGAPVRVRVERLEGEEGRALVVLAEDRQSDEGERLTSLYLKIRTIKHEINNPLTGALGNINLLLRRPDLDEKSRRRLATAEQEIKKVSQLVVLLSELAPVAEAKTTDG